MNKYLIKAEGARETKEGFFYAKSGKEACLKAKREFKLYGDTEYKITKIN
jgi:hypothetical protein